MKKTRLKEIMKNNIRKRTEEDMKAILRGIEADHRIIFIDVSYNITLDYNDETCCWNYTAKVYLAIDDDFHGSYIAKGILRDDGDTSLMWVYDMFTKETVWKLFDREGRKDANRQIEYYRLVEAA